MNDPAADYASEVTNLSYRELQNLALWASHRGPDLYLIGGWAAWHYHGGLGSRDIDVIFQDRNVIDRFLYEYYKENGFIAYGGLLAKRYRKPVEMNRQTVYIEIDAASFDDGQPFKEDETKHLPFALVHEHNVRWDLGHGSVRVPTPELLLLQKVKAHRDRSWDHQYRATSPIDIAYLRSKIWKDGRDILGIAPFVRDWRMVWHIAAEHECADLVKATLDAIEAPYPK